MSSCSEHAAHTQAYMYYDETAAKLSSRSVSLPGESDRGMKEDEH